MVIPKVDWLELPDHLTTLFTDKLPRCDFIRFGAVCKSWLSIYTKHPRHSLPHQIPLLLLHTFEHILHDIYDLSEKRVSRFQVSVPIPEDCNHVVCRGSNHSWLAIFWIYYELRLCLTNPLLSEDKNINLPPLGGDDCDIEAVKKLVLSADPILEPNFVVMVIMERGRLAFHKPAGDRTGWIYLDTESKYIDDAIYYRDQFYFVDTFGSLFSCNLNHPHDLPKVSLVAPPPYSTFGHTDDGTKYIYLVELLSGELLLIKRFRKYIKDNVPFYTLGFSAYTMNPLVELKWNEVQNLCGETVFLDDYSSLSFRASECPECKPNCFYFIDYGYFYMDEFGIRKPYDRDDYVNYSGMKPDYVGSL